MEINEEIGIIRVKLESTKNKVRCYTSAYSGIYNFETANLQFTDRLLMCLSKLEELKHLSTKIINVDIEIFGDLLQNKYK